MTDTYAILSTVALLVASIFAFQFFDVGQYQKAYWTIIPPVSILLLISVTSFLAKHSD